MGKLKIVENSTKLFCISIGLIVLIVIGLFIRGGVQLDIQFKGGSIITYTYEGNLDTDQFRGIVQRMTNADISFQQSTDLATQKETLVVSLPGNEGMNADLMSEINDELQETFPDNNIQVLSSNNVDPTIGGEFLAKCLTAVGVAALLMVIYVWLRFRRIGGLSAGVMAVIALLHDIVIVFGVFVVLGFSINDNFIAVVLTILGYSLNDTIVIYDRIRENERRVGNKMKVGELVDLSINQSFKRSMMTSITTISAMVIVTVVAFIYNVDTIVTFAFPLIIGLTAGTYSSLCIAGPLWVKWQEHKLKKA